LERFPVIGITEFYPQALYGAEPSVEQLCEYMKWASTLGFKSIELTAITREHFYSLFHVTKNIKALRESYRSSGLELAAFEAYFCGAMTVDPRSKEALLRDFKNAIGVASDLETRLVYMLSWAPPEWDLSFYGKTYGTAPPTQVKVRSGFSWESAWNRYCETAGTMAELAEESGIKMGIEIRPFEIVSNSDGMLALIKASDSDNLGLVLDTGHLFFQREVLPISVQKLGKKIFHVHLNDNDGLRNFHWPPGKGSIDWKAFLMALKNIDYSGFLMLDITGEYRRAEEITSDAQMGRDFIRKVLVEIRSP